MAQAPLSSPHRPDRELPSGSRVWAPHVQHTLCCTLWGQPSLAAPPWHEAVPSITSRLQLPGELLLNPPAETKSFTVEPLFYGP